MPDPSAEFIPFDRANPPVVDPEPLDPQARRVGDRVRAQQLARLLLARGGASALILAIGPASVAFAEAARATLRGLGPAGVALFGGLRIVEGISVAPYTRPGDPPLGPVDVVLAFGLAASLPRKVLSVEGGEWTELQVRSLAGAEPEYRWEPLTLAWALEDVHVRTLRARVASLGRVVVVYPTALFELLRRVDPLLAPGAIVVVADVQAPPAEDLISAREASPGFDFELLDAFGAEEGTSVLRVRDSARATSVAVLCQADVAVALSAAVEAIYRVPAADDAEDFAATAKKSDALAAMRYWRRCAAIAPADLEVHFEFISACVDAGRARLALAVLDEYDRSNAQFDFDFLRGRALAALFDIRGAIVAYERSLTRDAHPVTYSNLGALYLAIGAFGLSEERYRSALSLVPEFPLALAGLARLQPAAAP